jgi:hypothetical protein
MAGKAMFKRVAQPCASIFCLLAATICYFDEVKQGFFHVVVWHSELIFCLLAGQKCNFVEAE